MGIKIGIVGHGFVGKATEYGFTKDDNEIIVIDPRIGTKVSDLINKNVSVVFVCAPTPMSADGNIDSSIIQSILSELEFVDVPLVVLKSTVTPEIVSVFASKYKNFVYNPEFLTEANALDDFVNPFVQVFGGDSTKTKLLEEIYANNSVCAPCKVKHTTASEASFVKYTINSFLALKVVFFNQIKDLIEENSCDYSVVKDAFVCDTRIGVSHTQVPGPDGRLGFGGSCFHKDVRALLHFSDNSLTVLKEAWNVNVDIRSEYVDLLEREKSQHVVLDKI